MAYNHLVIKVKHNIHSIATCQNVGKIEWLKAVIEDNKPNEILNVRFDNDKFYIFNKNKDLDKMFMMFYKSDNGNMFRI